MAYARCLSRFGLTLLKILTMIHIQLIAVVLLMKQIHTPIQKFQYKMGRLTQPFASKNPQVAYMGHII